MKRIDVALLWHMHQPYYVDPRSKTAMMPWVRLHAVKGYTDMIDLAQRHPAVRMSFNFTPVLVRQLLELASGEVKDLWLEWSRKDPADLDRTEKLGILEHFFKIHWGNLIEPFRRYRELLEMRGRHAHLRAVDEASGFFNDQDIRDLQVWFNLNWCGFALDRAYPELKQLRQKGRGFSEEEKQRVLDIHMETVGCVLRRYAEAQEQGLIELTTTPFFHPIMPLVYDTDIAARAMPGRELPKRFHAPEDVRAHLRLAQEQHSRVFGKAARGMWPSEGSVCPEILPLMAEAGIEYFCTDEDVLFRGLGAQAGRNADHLELFQVWESGHGDAGLKAFFRERPLSDFIGFQASRASAEHAAKHLRHHLEHIAKVAGGEQSVVCLALDGENAWECFADGGEHFLSLFYQDLENSKALQPVRLGEAADKAKVPPKTGTLHSGSWIQANFDIWIGDAEENKGWEWIGRTREFLISMVNSGDIQDEKLQQAWQEIYAAEGSDWFWWYGPDFQTDCDMLFDMLFRRHLQNVYLILDREPPAYLECPIRRREIHGLLTEPTDYITPVISGDAAHYYEWLGAGHYAANRAQGAMFQGDRKLEDFYFGFDKTSLYLRMDLRAVPEVLVVDFGLPKEFKLELRADGSGGLELARPEKGICLAFRDRLEIAIPLPVLGYENPEVDNDFALAVRFLENGQAVEHYPTQGMIEFEGPREGFELRNWFV